MSQGITVLARPQVMVELGVESREDYSELRNQRIGRWKSAKGDRGRAYRRTPLRYQGEMFWMSKNGEGWARGNTAHNPLTSLCQHGILVVQTSLQ